MKEQLTLREMKCGGTLEERALRLFLCKGVKGDLRKKLDPKVFAKRKVEATKLEDVDDDRRYVKQKGPLLEYQWMRRNQKKLPRSGPQY